MSERKILYSPGYGAGWSSWSSGDMAKLMLTYAPIIEAIERGDVGILLEPRIANKGEIGESIIGGYDFTNCHPSVVQLARDCASRFNEVPYMGGLDQLKVATVSGRVRIHEYDGSESYEVEGGFEDWM